MRLTPSALAVLLHLVVARLRGGDGWIHRNDMGASDEQGWKGISRLKEQLQSALPAGTRLYENDGHGQYRLHPDIQVAGVDHVGLSDHASHEVRELAAKTGQLSVEAPADRGQGLTEP